MLRNRSIVIDIIVAMVLIVTLFSSFALLLNVTIVSQKNEQLFFQKSDEFVNYFRKNLELPLWNYDSYSIEKLGKITMSAGLVTSLVIRTENGYVWFDEEKEDEPAFEIKKQSVYYENELVGSFEIGLSQKEYKIQNQQIVISGLVTVLIVTSGIIGFVWIIVDQFIQRPIKNFSDQIYAIARGDYETKDLDTPYKEVNNVLTRFDRMAEKVQNREVNLESLIRDRTKDLEDAKDKAEIANQAKSRFLANMSHEIRTPLNAVTGFSELLSTMVQDEKQRSYLSSIRTAGKNLLTLINDILDLSKIEVGRLEIQCVKVDLRRLFQEIHQIFRLQIEQKNLEFTIEVDDRLPRLLLLDEIRLRQVLLNIVGNAVKFTQSGGIALGIEIINYNISDKKSDIRIFVQDSGMGIDPDHLEKIFESFRQQPGQDISQFGGTGLGLSISKGLIEMMNGLIHVESQIDQGSLFKIDIPGVNIPENQVSLIKPVRDTNPILFERQKVLVVDDIESNRQMLEELLTVMNLEVQTANNGQEALEKADEYLPDLILMDLRMPVLDGFEASDHLKRNAKTQGIPIIAVTASSTSLDSGQILEKGMDGYLAKPFELADLIDVIRPFLQTVSHTDDGADTSHNDKNDKIKDISETGFENILELLNLLEKDFMKTWETFESKQPIQQVKNFAMKLEQIGEKFGVGLLERYSHDLNESAENFDINQMREQLKDFPAIIQKLHSFKDQNSDERK